MRIVFPIMIREEECRTLREGVRKKSLSLKEWLHLAVTKLLQEEVKLNPEDTFFSRKTVGRSGRRDLSRAHDKYLYGKDRAHVL